MKVGARSLLLSLALLGGAGFGSVEPQSSNGDTGRSHQDGFGPIRLTRDYPAQQRATTRPALNLPLGPAWKCFQSAQFVASGDSLRIGAGSDPARLELPVTFPAEHYNEVRVRMKVDSGSHCIFKWESELEPSFGDNPGVSVPIFDDDGFHTYTIPFHIVAEDTWWGRINKIQFLPSDKPATVEISSFELVHHPPAGPRRITIVHQTHEAVLGSQPPWVVAVPDEATFEAHLGLAEHAWRDLATDGVRFVAVLEGKGIPRVVLVDKTLNPMTVRRHKKWVRIQADLGVYAGKQVCITLTVDNLGSTRGDYAFWGNPMVFSRQADESAVPVILVSWDTVRADHLSCYGYHRETSPHLDQWAEEAVLFENAIASEAWTLPAHMTMFTGLHPKNHAVTSVSNLPEDVVTLTEILADAGYLTAAFTGFKWWLLPWRGFAQGFDLYNTPTSAIRNISSTRPLVNTWLTAHPIPRLFLFFHNFDAHVKYQGVPPYRPPDPKFLHFSTAFNPPPTFDRDGNYMPRGESFILAVNRGEFTLTKEERAYCLALYDDCIRAIDQEISEFFETLKERGLYDRSLIIVTADHGEEFAEHGLYGHKQVYEECSRVPLIIKFPYGKFAGRRFTPMVQLMDLYPTILDILGLPTHSPLDGRSLVGLLEGKREPQLWGHLQRFDVHALRTNQWKLLHRLETGDYELYDLLTDSEERENVYKTSPPELPRLTQQLDRFFQPNPEGWHLALPAGRDKGGFTLELACADGFATLRLLPGREIHRRGSKRKVSENRRRVKVTLPHVNGDEVLVRPASSRGSIRVSLASDTEFAVTARGETLRPANLYEAVLDPADGPYAKPPDTALASRDRPIVYIWYVEPTAKRTAAKPLSEEARRELEALGYVQ